MNGLPCPSCDFLTTCAWHKTIQNNLYFEDKFCLFYVVNFSQFDPIWMLSRSFPKKCWIPECNVYFCRSEMWVMPFLLLNAVLTLITLVVACIVSVGFAIFCNNYLDGLPSYAK